MFWEQDMIMMIGSSFSCFVPTVFANYQRLSWGRNHYK